MPTIDTQQPIPITVDTREQRPWAFPELVAVVTVGTLRAGDYAITGDTRFAIERKSLPDFAGTVGSGWSRFGRELDRMSEAGFVARCIIVEGTFAELAEGLPEHPRLTPLFLLRRLAELTMMGVSVLFAGDAEHASVLAWTLLKHRYLDMADGTETLCLTLHRICPWCGAFAVPVSDGGCHICTHQKDANP